MWDFLQNLFVSDFMPHGHCYLWSPGILWLHVVADTIITLSYYSIPIALMVVVQRRKDLAFSWIYVLFSIFIICCGTTHLLEIWNVWHGAYRLSGVVKLLTAVASAITAILIWPLLPKLLALPSTSQLEDANKMLLKEAAQRRDAQAKLLVVNAELESKVQRATADLQMTLAQKSELLTRERVARTEVEKSSRLKDEFLTTLSHELRTPLNAIASWIQVLSADTNAPAQLSTSALVSLRDNVAKLSGIIDDLLDMSSILTGSVTLNARPYSLAAVLDDVVTGLTVASEAKKLTIDTDIDPNGVPTLRGDVLRIRQIIWNLLSNAIKFTPEGKKIVVSITVQEATVKLIVSDEGRGIDTTFLPHVFERFRQEFAQPSREYTGLGLGLSLARQLAELHGGSITAESEGRDKGARFTLILPRAL